MIRALLDTHLLLWAAMGSPRLPATVSQFLDDPAVEPVFSVASIWEVVIKSGLDRPDFTVDPQALRRGLVAAGYIELPIEAPHALAVALLPKLHADPFDRMLLAQARVEALPLLTVDEAVLAYGAPAMRDP